MNKVDELMSLVIEHGAARYDAGFATACGGRTTEVRKLESEADELKAELRTALAEALGGWRPISEAPRDGTPCILGRSDIPAGKNCVYPAWSAEGFFDSETQTWRAGSLLHNATFELDKPTHYQPLPQPPETAP